MKKIAVLLAILLCLSLTATVSAEEYEMKYGKSFYEKVIRLECEYIKSLALPNGAVGYGVPKVSGEFEASVMPTVDGVSPEEYTTWPSTKIVPYFSAFAVLGIMEADYDGAQKLALDYINWYTEHMNTKESDVNGVAGTVYDYYIFVSPEGKVIEVTFMDALNDKTRNYDSTDSYASTFIQILCAYTQKYDPDFLSDKKELIDTLVGVIDATYCKRTELTGAKPDYMVCYLMDNCEVYGAFRDLAALYPEYKKQEEAYRKAIVSTLGADGYFYPAVFEDGKAAYTIPDTSSFDYYPHGTSQLFPITFGVVDADSDTAKRQYELFNSVYGQTGKNGYDWTVVSCGSSYPWALNLRAAVKMNDFRRADRYIDYVYTNYIATEHEHAYYCAEAGHMLLATTELIDKVFGPEQSVPDTSEVTNPIPIGEEKSPITFKKALPYIALGAVVIAGAAAIILALKKKK